MCSSFCNNLIYSGVFLSCAPRSKFVKIENGSLVLVAKVSVSYSFRRSGKRNSCGLTDVDSVVDFSQ